MKKMNKKQVITTAAALSMIMALGVGGSFAYLTDGDTETNTFTTGKVSIDLTEPTYPGNADDAVKNLVPLQEVAKDPMITNDGINDAIVFLEVDIPMDQMITANADGTRNAEAYVEIFDFAKAGGTYDSVNDGWVLINSEKDNDATPTKMTYRYGYNTRLAKDGETAKLFDTVRLANVIEGEIDESTQDIAIRAYAIQADYVNEIDTTGTLSEQTLKDIFTVYSNQN